MRRIALLPMLAAMALPAFAIDVVTVDQLQQAVTAVHGKSDKEEAQRLGKLELKERLSDARYERLRASLPGEKSRMALLALADASAFLDLPSVDIPATAAPDRAAQVALLAKTAEYMKGAISMLPDFFATRETIFFAGGPAKTSQSAGKNRRDAALQVVSKFAATIRFLGGREEVADEHAEYGKHNPPGQELAVHGVYGPIFDIVLKDALDSSPSWSHWEHSSAGPMAVFRYAVPKEKSQWGAQVPGDPGFLGSIVAYHGEIGVDPADGAILRLTLEAAPRPNGPIAKANILIEYGPVEIGGRSYICPIKSVGLSLARNLNLLQDVYGVQQGNQLPFQLQMDDVSFTQYHLFHAEMRVLPAESSGQEGVAHPPVPATEPKAPSTRQSP